MLKARIIPTLLWKNHGLVKGVGFDSWRRVGTLLPAIRVYETRRVDELVLLDIAATAEGRSPDLETIADAAAECFMPLTVGGGVRSVDDIRALLRAGADKVAINSAAIDDPGIVSAGAAAFGAQCLVACVDCRRMPDGSHRCFARAGGVDTGREAAAWAAELERRGAGEILVTSIERDGSMSGYDLDLVRKVAGAVTIPVIAAGGCGSYEDMRLAIAEGGAQAVSAAAIFHFTEKTPLEAKRYLRDRGIPVRIL